MAFYRVNVVKTTFSRRFNNQDPAMPRLLEFESVIHSVALEAYMRLPMIVEVSLTLIGCLV